MSGGGVSATPFLPELTGDCCWGEQSEGIRLWLIRLSGIDPGHEGRPVFDPRLVVDGLQVVLHRLLGQGQSLGDLTVGGAPHQMKEDFPLAVREIPGGHFL